MAWTGSVIHYGILLAVVYLIWYVFRGRTTSGIGAPRPNLARAGEEFAALVGVFYLFGLLGSRLGWSAMGAEEIVGTSLVFAVYEYLRQLTLFLKGRRDVRTNAEL
ncbi:hypothetical protein BH24DEI2_BH24DEI2_17070 [soil metagenome]